MASIRTNFFILFVLVLFVIIPKESISQKHTIAVDSSVIAPVYFDKNKLEKYRNNKDFDYTEIKEKENSFLQKIKQWIKNYIFRFFKWLFGESKALKYFSAFIRIIPYFILAIVLFLLLKFFMKIDTFGLNTKTINETNVIYSNEKDLIKNQDLNKLISDAIKSEDYRLAVRYYYLKSLKLLEQKELIKWEDQKTNYEYLKELKDSRFKPSFEKFTFWYDYVWYGDFSIDSIEFESISKSFNQFYKDLGI